MSAFFDLVRALIDGATRVPFLVWVALVIVGVGWWLVFVAVTTECTNPEQRDEIERRYREWAGHRAMPPTRSTARPSTGRGTSQHHATSGEARPALGRPRPRRDRHT